MPLSAQVPPAEDRSASGSCVAIMLPNVEGAETSGVDVGAGVRDLFGRFLTGPSIKPVFLEARLLSQAMEEAQQKKCTYVLSANLARKHNSGKGVFGQIVGQTVGSAAYQIPGAGSVAGAVAQSAAVASAQAISAMATSTKARDELSLDYRLLSSTGAAVLGPTIQKSKAKTDGEDLLTPVVRQASENIAAAVAKKR